MKTSLRHIVIVALTTAFAATIATSSAQDWPQYLFENGHSSLNGAATAITTDNASTLVEDWSFIDPHDRLETDSKPIDSTTDYTDGTDKKSTDTRITETR